MSEVIDLCSDDDDLVDSPGLDGALGSVTPEPTKNPNNDLLAQLRAEREARRPTTTTASEVPPRRPLRLLTYNVWFREDVQVEKRMEAIGRIIEANDYPEGLCFQEVTPAIYALFSSSSWWSHYVASPPPMELYFTSLLIKKDRATLVGPGFCNRPFENSKMGRGMLTASLLLDGQEVFVGTSHLESPCGKGQEFSAERQQQMGEVMDLLAGRQEANVVYGGDMNWLENMDGAIPLHDGLQDAWVASGERDPGFTYDSRANPMVLGNWPGQRMDRVFFKVSGWKLKGVCLLGKEPLPGVQHEYVRRDGRRQQVPVLPSDHFGLLTTFLPC